MDRLWTPWRYTYITDAIPQRFKGVPTSLEPWLTNEDPAAPPFPVSPVPVSPFPVSPVPVSPVPVSPVPVSPFPVSPFPDKHCVFCNMFTAVDYAIARGLSPQDAEQAALIVHRGVHCYICLNRFPYSTGHVLIVPYHHVDSLAALPPAAALEVITLAQQTETALRQVYRPDGLNFGLNLGQAAGAGVADHLHLHALPRWSGDVNFMTSTAETRVLPETLEVTWRRLRTALVDHVNLSAS